MEGTIERHKEWLIERMDPDFGLLDKLFASGRLQKREFDNIKLAPSTVEDRCERLLTYILEKNMVNELLSALESTNQTHLVNYIRADGGYKPEFNEDWPLGEDEQKRMAVNRPRLIEIIDYHDLCAYLISKEVINTRQHDFISSKSSKSEKNEVLLEVMYRFSIRQFWTCVSCLHESNQRHVADVLSQSGVVVGVHASLQGSSPNVDEREEVIVSRITNYMLENSDISTEEWRRFSPLAELRLLAVRRGNSVLLYFHCLTLEELLRLHELTVNGSLKRTVEEVFIKLLRAETTIIVLLTWSEGDFERIKLYFAMSEKDSKAPIKRNMEQKLQEMELEKDLPMVQKDLGKRLERKKDEQRTGTVAIEEQRLEFQQQKRAWEIERKVLHKYQADYEKRRVQD